jgi:tagatose-1,6-bisphosphate aldolase
LGQIGAQHLSGLVVDPIYSFSLINHGGAAGLLTRVTTLNEEVDPLVVPTLIPDYGLEELSENYSLAKLELYYHPQEEKALQKKQLLAEIHDYCDYLDIHLLLKLIIYTPAKVEFTQEQFQQDQLQAVQELSNLTDLIALQYPLTPLATATITAELDTPWILMNQKQNYEEFKQILRASLENGAVGFIAGQSLWSELANYKQSDHSPDLAKIKEFVETTFQDRLIELMRIVKEGSDG